jgi:GT2 family glycosyltransferase
MSRATPTGSSGQGSGSAALFDVSLCVPVYKVHGPPNLSTLAETFSQSLGGLRGELIVALNGISAGEARAPLSARTVELKVNHGVSVGWNRAASTARGDILCFSNDDVLLGPDSVRLLVDALRARPEAGVVGPVGTRWLIEEGRHLAWVDVSGLPTGEVQECEVVSGFLFATRRQTFEAVGGFDEILAPCSWEEVDYCTAVRKRLGLKCYAVAGVVHDHKFGISAPQKPWARIRFDGRSESLWSIHRRNRRRFLSKWGCGAEEVLARKAKTS